MNRRLIVVLIAVAFCIVSMIYFASRGSDDDVAAELLERANQRSATEPGSAESANEFDLDALAAEGKAMPLPTNLEATPTEDGAWLVAKVGDASAAYLPFAPSRIPKPPSDEKPSESSNPGFVGAASCRECHAEKHDGFVHTAHFKTSSPASLETVLGSFEQDRNLMRTRNPSVYFEMINRDSDLIQRVTFHDWKFDVPINLVTGSAKLGQTYLYWDHDLLYQSSVTYLTSSDQWINSPGYIDGDAMYSRKVSQRCLECHTTFIEHGEELNQFVPSSIIYGVSCERCHGPGKQHVDYHREHRSEKTARHIVSPAQLTREQQLDICGQCHTGTSKLVGEPYQFRPGDRLEEHYIPADSKMTGSVHSSNQHMRLSLSRCFNATEMTCTSCHNPHQAERGKSKLFSERCMNCHTSNQCGMHSELGAKLEENCIDCHMAAGRTDKMWLKTANETVFPKLRDHYIRVDPIATEQYLERAATTTESDPEN